MSRKLASAGRFPTRRIVEFVTMLLDYPTLANVTLIRTKNGHYGASGVPGERITGIAFAPDLAGIPKH
jgi:hypothetical protein